ncbi:MAG: NAD(+)/NADH kinase [Bacteroidales bacterium]|jgi:NAD+ kinase|nr:NAD(+)/NADH kinase [Bacteroidales bacterium]
MKIAIYTRDESALSEPRFRSMSDRLASEGFSLYNIKAASDILEGTGMVLSAGGDGTFLSASKRVGDSGIPVLGVNMGRVGFLSEYSPEEACEALIKGTYSLEDRALLETRVDGEMIGTDSSFWPYTLNEISVLRGGASILGVDVSLDGNPLPTYWADGLLVSTSSGSTAYSLSVGGPICVPDAKVIIIAPIAPHNLNVRPLVVPDTTVVSISMRSRDKVVAMSMDNRNVRLSSDASLEVKVAQFSLKRVRLEKSSFIKALTTKLFWGEDIRNGGI